jgi:hypothetical protein
MANTAITQVFVRYAAAVTPEEATRAHAVARAVARAVGVDLELGDPAPPLVARVQPLSPLLARALAVAFVTQVALPTSTDLAPAPAPMASVNDLLSAQAVLLMTLGAVAACIGPHPEETRCRICRIQPETVRVAPCGHLACGTCITNRMATPSAGTCPRCQCPMYAMQNVY